MSAIRRGVRTKVLVDAAGVVRRRQDEGAKRLEPACRPAHFNGELLEPRTRLPARAFDASSPPAGPRFEKWPRF